MKRKIFVLIFSILFTFYYSQENSEQNERIENILKELKENKENFEEMVFSEKKLPNSENFAVCLPIENGKEDGATNYNLYILICDKNGKILNKYFENNAISSDAIFLDYTEIDTGNYLIKENLRAFGIRLHYRNMSQPNPYSKEDILMFYTEKEKLIKILDYQINEYHGEWNLNCNGEFEEERGYISFEKSETNGFRNMKIRTKIEKKYFIGKDSKTGDCKEKKSQKFQTKILKFSKGKYQ